MGGTVGVGGVVVSERGSGDGRGSSKCEGQ